MNNVNYKYEWFVSSNQNETISSLITQTLLDSEQEKNLTVSKLLIGNDAFLSQDSYIYILVTATLSGFEQSQSLKRSSTKVQKGSVVLSEINFIDVDLTVGGSITTQFVVTTNVQEYSENSHITK